MPAQRKIDILASLKEKLKKAQAVVLTDYSSLTHQQLEELRRSLKKLGAHFQIVKNSLLKLALSSYLKPPVSGLQINGPTAVALTTRDDLSPLEMIYKKSQELNALKIKWGIWGGEIVEREQIVRLATLPAHDVLLGQLLFCLDSPKNRLVYILKGNLEKLLLILKKGVKKSE